MKSEATTSLQIAFPAQILGKVGFNAWQGPKIFWFSDQISDALRSFRILDFSAKSLDIVGLAAHVKQHKIVRIRLPQGTCGSLISAAQPTSTPIWRARARGDRAWKVLSIRD